MHFEIVSVERVLVLLPYCPSSYSEYACWWEGFVSDLRCVAFAPLFDFFFWFEVCADRTHDSVCEFCDLSLQIIVKSGDASLHGLIESDNTIVHSLVELIDGLAIFRDAFVDPV